MGLFAGSTCGRLAVLTLCLAAAGCLDKTETVTLNPDGSGKSEMVLLISPQSLGAPASQNKPGEEELRSFAEEIIHRSPDVEAWKDVTFGLASDGRFRFKGTAYFRSFNSQTGSPWSTSTWKKDPTGAMVLEVRFENTEAADGADGPPANDAEVQQRIAEAKTQWQQMKPMATAMLGSFRDDTTYVLPGKVTDAGGLEATPKGLRLVIEGKKLVGAVDTLMADEAALTAAVKSGKDPLKHGFGQEKMAPLVWGRPATLKIRVGPEVKPIFDYEAEVVAAKSAMPEMLRKLGLSPSPARGTVPPAATPARSGNEAAPASRVEVPFGIDKRPMPKDAALDTLAPKKVGEFERMTVEAAEDEPGVRAHYARYKRVGAADEAVVMGVFVYKSPAEAQKSFAGRDRDPLGLGQTRLGSALSFYYLPNGQCSWTRGPYCWSVQAWGEKDLDPFVKSFPY